MSGVAPFLIVIIAIVLIFGLKLKPPEKDDPDWFIPNIFNRRIRFFSSNITSKSGDICQRRAHFLTKIVKSCWPSICSIKLTYWNIIKNKILLLPICCFVWFLHVLIETLKKHLNINSNCCFCSILFSLCLRFGISLCSGLSQNSRNIVNLAI